MYGISNDGGGCGEFKWQMEPVMCSRVGMAQGISSHSRRLNNYFQQPSLVGAVPPVQARSLTRNHFRTELQNRTLE